MPYEVIGAAGLTVEIRQTYDRALLMRAVPYFVHAKFGKKATIPARGGKAVQWRRLEAVAATTTALTEGTPGAVTQITFSSVTATLDQYGQYSQLSDVVNTQTIDPVVAELVEAFGEVAGNSLDQVVRNVITGGTNIQYASTAGSRLMVGSGMLMNYAEIREAVSTLARADAKRFADGTYKAIIHPDTARDIFADSDVLNSFQRGYERGGNNPMYTGKLGVFYGVEFIETTNARIRTSLGLSGMNVYQSLFFGQEWYGVSDYDNSDLSSMEVIVKPLGSAGTSDPLNQLSTVGWKAAITAKVLNDNFGVSVEHGTSRHLAS